MMTAQGILDALKGYIGDVQRAAEEEREGAIRNGGDATPVGKFCLGRANVYDSVAHELEIIIRDSKEQEDGYYERLEEPVEN